jgi:hypothetical protein
MIGATKHMNKELLLKVKEQILREPRQFQMDAFFTARDADTPNCGTAACIAGWAIAIHLAKQPSRARRELVGDYATYASEILGHNADRLFYLDEWPDHLYERWLKSESTDECAQIAAEAIDDFIAHNGYDPR